MTNLSSHCVYSGLVLFGCLIGMERTFHDRPAAFFTHVPVSSAMLPQAGEFRISPTGN